MYLVYHAHGLAATVLYVVHTVEFIRLLLHTVYEGWNEGWIAISMNKSVNLH